MAKGFHVTVRAGTSTDDEPGQQLVGYKEGNPPARVDASPTADRYVSKTTTTVTNDPGVKLSAGGVDINALMPYIAAGAALYFGATIVEGTAKLIGFAAIAFFGMRWFTSRGGQKGAQ